MTKQFQVEIVNVGAPTKVPTARGFYSVIEVAYKQDGKVTGKKFPDCYNPVVYPQLQSSKPGDNFLVTSEKDAKGYYQWTSIEQVAAEAAGSASAQPGATGGSGQATTRQNTSGGSSGRVTGSNYETPEERATKQAIIVRQFAINAAIEALKAVTTIEGSDTDVEDIKVLARQIEDFVYTDIEGRIASIRAAVKQA